MVLLQASVFHLGIEAQERASAEKRTSLAGRGSRRTTGSP
jgi:hypothetical protein